MMKRNLHIVDDSCDLNDREKAILRTIIHLYIMNANPIGSRNLSKYLEKELKLSPATIRNVMADLEERELICHPHTSAGRIPTDKGYRLYVDSLMEIGSLTESELLKVKESIVPANPENLLKDASKVLGMISSYLSIVQIPSLYNIIVQKIELIGLSSTRLLVVIAMDSSIVKTVTLEAEFELDLNNLETLSSFINEKISGKPLAYINENFRDIISQYQWVNSPLIRLFVDSIDKLFDIQKGSEKIHISGTQNLLHYPEFDSIERVKGVIELIENEEMIIHIIDKSKEINSDVKVMIGNEMGEGILEDYSLVLSSYSLGSAKGAIGLIGPKRMNYSRVITLVKYFSELVSNL